MKNFKKVLALVLAIATLLSFATVASAKTADFADAKDVQNVEALDVLSYIKVLEGYKADNTFKPAKNITREEAAKIIAIFANKSTDISSLYTSANPFADMKGRWGESYVAYGYRAGIIAGKNATSFVPKANVKGTEFLKMVLVVLGYDQNKEGLVGSSWAVNTLELAKAKKLLAGLGSSFDPNAALTRDQAAQIMLNALKAEKVVYGQTITNLVWNAKAGYWMAGTNVASNAVYVSPNGAVNNYEHKLLAADFGLELKNDASDAWGRPAHKWLKGTTTIGTYTDTPVVSYHTAVTECQVATDTKQSDKEVTYKVIVNGANETTTVIQTLDTVNTIGAQGRLTEVYEDRIVMIDTFLAYVKGVKDATYDAAGHLKTESKITLSVYDKKNAVTELSVENGATNYTYAVGDYVLVNAYTDAGTISASGNVTKNVVILGKAESFEGAQTVIWYNAAKHTVEGTAYDDALKFLLDQAGTETGKHTWFKDQYGNLIGVIDVETVYSYGVITKIWTAGNFADGSDKILADVTYIDGTTNQVTVKSFKLVTSAVGYDDGTTVDNTVYTPVADNTYSTHLMKFIRDTTDNKNTVGVSYSAAANAKADANDEEVILGHLFQMETKADGTVAFTKVNDGATNAVHTEVKGDTLNVNVKWGWLTSVAKVDTATTFLNYDPATKEFKVYNGINECPTFTKATVDYTISDGYAKYVYIIGTPDSAKTEEFVYIANNTHNATLKDDGIEYWEINLNVTDKDGNAVTLKVDKDHENVKKTLMSTENVGKLFYVKFEGGFAVQATEVTSTADNTKYGATDETYARVKLAGKAASYANGILRLNNASNVATDSYNITDAEIMVGTLDKTKTYDLTDNVIYVIFNGTNAKASKVYILEDLTPDDPAKDPWQNRNNVFWYNNDEHLYKVIGKDTTLGEFLKESFNESTKKAWTLTYKVTDATGTKVVTVTEADYDTYKDYTVSSLLGLTDATLTVENDWGSGSTAWKVSMA